MNRTKMYFVFLTLMSTVVFSCSKDDGNDDPNNQINIPDGYSMVWSDEFNDSSINNAHWQYETGDGTDYGLPAGWGNNELQFYTESANNSGVEKDGEVSALYVRALSNGVGGYTSAKLTTKNLFSMRFGRVDIKAKMPKGKGLWAAIWMLGDNKDQISWPGCGEIDIAEILGDAPNIMYSTLHYTDSDQTHGEIQKSHELSNATFNDAYHVFSLDWTPDSLSFRVDGLEIQQVPIKADMKEFLRSFYLVLNVAVGGNWPGAPDNSTPFPQTMYVDYVRVFEKIGFEAPEAPTLVVDEETIGQIIEPSIAQHAIKNTFTDLGNATVVVYGGGGEPVIAISEIAIDGDSSLVFNFPGGNWGGGYIELKTPKDLSGYSTLKFSLKTPATLTTAEIKLESRTTNAVVFLADYTGIDVGQGFLEFSIPLADFSGLDLTKISIAFSIWNPQDANGNFVEASVLIDNLYFSN